MMLAAPYDRVTTRTLHFAAEYFYRPARYAVVCHASYVDAAELYFRFSHSGTFHRPKIGRRRRARHASSIDGPLSHSAPSGTTPYIFFANRSASGIVEATTYTQAEPST